MAPRLAGYATEIRLIEQDIAKAGGIEAQNEPAGTERVTRYVYRLYQRASLAGDPTGLGAVARAIDRAIPFLVHPGDLYLLKANVAFKLHQFANVQSALRAVPSVYHSNEGRLIRADLDFQFGRYQTAKNGYCAVLKTERSWGALARLAHFCGKMGDPAGADELYEEAQDDLTAKEMRAFAWLEVQRGFLDFARGHYREAQSHYDRAEAAYPGYWLVDEHVAELLAAQDRYGDAIAILERVVSAAHRPELDQAIGELYQRTGQEERARQQMQKALTAYLEFRPTRRGALLAPPRRLLCRCRQRRIAGRRLGAEGSAAPRKFLNTGGAGLGLLPRWPICGGPRLDRSGVIFRGGDRAPVFASR